MRTEEPGAVRKALAMKGIGWLILKACPRIPVSLHLFDGGESGKLLVKSEFLQTCCGLEQKYLCTKWMFPPVTSLNVQTRLQ